MKPLTPEQRDEMLAWVEEMREDIVVNPAGFPRAFKYFLDANTHKYEPPTVIYKGSGFTGAQKEER